MKGLTKKEVGEFLYQQAREAMADLVAKGMSEQDAARAVAHVLNEQAWNMAVSPSPLGDV